MKNQDMNEINLTGRVGHTPELKVSAAGKPWMTLRLATNRRERNAVGEFVQRADWHDLRLFGKNAEQIAASAAQGSLLSVRGQLVYDNWQDDDGNARRTARVLVREIVQLDDVELTLPPRRAASAETEQAAA